MFEKIVEDYLNDVVNTFYRYQKIAEKALEQVSDEDFFTAIDAESNSIAAIVKHIGGNLRSRWTDFLVADGEKPDRNRDSEFIADGDTRESLTEFWENGWRALFQTFESLDPADFEKTVRIRGEDYTVIRAINRSLTHTASHIGQITLLAKHFRGADWKTLSIPKNKSAESNGYLSENKEKAHYLEATSDFAGKIEQDFAEALEKENEK